MRERGCGAPFLAHAECSSRRSPARINTTIKQAEAKVVDFCYLEDIEDAGKKASGPRRAVCAKGLTRQQVLCRCWKSANFPYCDGAHVKHNAETGDNVGPAICCKKPPPAAAQ